MHVAGSKGGGHVFPSWPQHSSRSPGVRTGAAAATGSPLASAAAGGGSPVTPGPRGASRIDRASAQYAHGSSTSLRASTAPTGRGRSAASAIPSSTSRPRSGLTLTAHARSPGPGLGGRNWGALAQTLGHGQSQTDAAVEGDYIRNLQEQIYLLELETRYLRSPDGEGADGVGGSDGRGGGMVRNADGHGSSYNGLNGGSSGNMNSSGGRLEPLETVISELKRKYVDLADRNRSELTRKDQVNEQLRSQVHGLELAAEESRRQVAELEKQIAQAQSHESEKNAALVTQTLTQQRKLQTAAAENARLSASYARVCAEKESGAQQRAADAEALAKVTQQVQELLQINAAQKQQVDALQKENQSLSVRLEDAAAGGSAQFDLEALQQQVRELTAEKAALLVEVTQAQSLRQQEQHLRERISADCQEHIATTIQLKVEVETLTGKLRREFEKQEARQKKRQEALRLVDDEKTELARLRGEARLQQIATETREAALAALKRDLTANELQLSQQHEARVALDEKVRDLENRLASHESELVALGTEHASTLDALAALKGASASSSSRVAALASENASLKQALARAERAQRDAAQVRRLLRDVEQSGQQHVKLMRGIRAQIAIDAHQIDDPGADAHEAERRGDAEGPADHHPYQPQPQSYASHQQSSYGYGHQSRSPSPEAFEAADLLLDAEDRHEGRERSTPMSSPFRA
ncbi:hypothetical protein CXG81DRAFT_17593 [Caulochytrium protostelioides]|uniref:Uncharacterized protein n=1 Tax=Caulochytrium protostelioides TaxID=1555241 RepID=A0A4P9XBK0_9FUNG|nr:hypothetical protein CAUPRSCDRAFT_10726 [Caulochytrium protostelioides]RKP02797.1 hypothetical protein CXG81DRAFT_17593 [Caulochytrium protostelioides]|eukprot:RKP02797.1 hypothetical protein CXG81DRAFT_17593 [Caulochytrium protostelioides]